MKGLRVEFMFFTAWIHFSLKASWCVQFTVHTNKVSLACGIHAV